MTNKKIATVILTVIFILIFIAVGVGSCGGIRYLIDNNQGATATVYADEIGTGELTYSDIYLVIPLNRYAFGVEGYSGYGFPSNPYGGKFMCFGDLRLVARSINGKLMSLFIESYQLDGVYQAGNYDTTDIVKVSTNITNQVVPIAFMDLGGASLTPGALSLTLIDGTFDIDTSGNFVSVIADVRAGNHSSGYFNLTFNFVNYSCTYVVEPYQWNRYGKYEINRIFNDFSYIELYDVSNGSVTVDLKSYYDKGFAAAYDKYYDSRFQLGKADGFNEGYLKGVAEANDYSFVSLIGAVIDVPVATFMGLFDVELLGINMASFYKALLALCMVVVVLRILMP